jgi:hypothetical protein
VAGSLLVAKLGPPAFAAPALWPGFDVAGRLRHCQPGVEPLRCFGAKPGLKFFVFHRLVVEREIEFLESLAGRNGLVHHKAAASRQNR